MWWNWIWQNEDYWASRREIPNKTRIREGPRSCCLFGSFLDNSSRKESRKGYESFPEHQTKYFQSFVLDNKEKPLPQLRCSSNFIRIISVKGTQSRTQKDINCSEERGFVDLTDNKTGVQRVTAKTSNSSTGDESWGSRSFDAYGHSTMTIQHEMGGLCHQWKFERTNWKWSSVREDSSNELRRAIFGQEQCSLRIC